MMETLTSNCLAIFFSVFDLTFIDFNTRYSNLCNCKLWSSHSMLLKGAG